MIKGLIAGASYPLRALRALQKSPYLLQFLIVPIIVNFVVAIAIYAGLLLPSWQGVTSLLDLISREFDLLIANWPQWLSFLAYLIVGLGWLLRGLLILGLFLLTGFLILQFGTLLGAPWYGQLSEHIEKYRTGRIEIVEINFFHDIWRAILFEVKKIVLWLIVAIPLLILGLIPAVGTLFITVSWFALTGFIMALDFLDGPSERRRLRFRQKMAIVWRSFPASASFSAVCWLLIGIPVVNFVTIPLCVASGTLFWCDRVLPTFLSSRES
ncbi:MAG: EI24 domain-containing protein [Jaaginema sp. PMC 1079.18]|nr:EI24 domain-containing protein [Jaaginema sp. PMC 1080.18]MEC4849572.1 EI24 domain-containing protein [Jaaginema sp. PMC 1079.18]MEC4866569.1 EI24 domain-containing protein [Jaaginema sp. PMC 1078.18]